MLLLGTSVILFVATVFFDSFKYYNIIVGHRTIYLVKLQINTVATCIDNNNQNAL